MVSMLYIALLKILVFLLFVWVCLFVVNFFHEMGHVLMGRIFFRDKGWHIVIGTGRTIIKLKRFTFRVIPIRGTYGFESITKGSKLQYIMMYLGGPLANLFFIVLLIWLSQVIKASNLELTDLVIFLEYILWANIGQFAFTVIPMKYWYWPYKGYLSDGMKILMKATEKDGS